MAQLRRSKVFLALVLYVLVFIYGCSALFQQNVHVHCYLSVASIDQGFYEEFPRPVLFTKHPVPCCNLQCYDSSGNPCFPPKGLVLCGRDAQVTTFCFPVVRYVPTLNVHPDENAIFSRSTSFRPSIASCTWASRAVPIHDSVFDARVVFRTE